jgi:hypothetical protein
MFGGDIENGAFDRLAATFGRKQSSSYQRFDKMVSGLPNYLSDGFVLARFVHEIGHRGSFESPSALGHSQSNSPLDTLDLALVISSWRKVGVRDLPCSRPL